MLLKAIEDKRFLPVGADKDVQSNFQLIAGTNKDLRAEVAAGRFREDLFARINLWTYVLPSLAQRREDIEPNIDHQLTASSQDLGKQVRFTTEARGDYLRFAQSSEAIWSGNFRDLSASITRLATLGENARIGAALVAAEIARLRWQWNGSGASSTEAVVSLAEVMGSAADALDYFDRLQLQAVITVCRKKQHGERCRPRAVQRLAHAAQRGKRCGPVAQIFAKVRFNLGKNQVLGAQLLF